MPVSQTPAAPKKRVYTTSRVQGLCPSSRLLGGMQAPKNNPAVSWMPCHAFCMHMALSHDCMWPCGVRSVGV